MYVNNFHRHPVLFCRGLYSHLSKLFGASELIPAVSWIKTDGLIRENKGGRRRKRRNVAGCCPLLHIWTIDNSIIGRESSYSEITNGFLQPLKQMLE
jgi:hypothetical protein